MKGLMNCMAWFSSKGLDTHITFIWLLSSMNFLINCKACIYTKCLATYITCTWLLSSKNSLMNFKLFLLSIPWPHTSHLYGFSPVWRVWWTVWLAFWLKAFPNTSHLYGLSPVWIIRWFWRCVFCLKQWPHTLHLYGLSPVWTLWWTWRDVFRLKQQPHISHLYGFSPVWFLWWTAWVALSLKALPHKSPLYGFLPVGILSCLESFESWRNVRSHSLGFFLCASWSGASSERCVTALSCFWETLLQTLRVLRWQTWGATVDIRHNLTTFKNCSFRLNYLQFILKAWSMPFNRLISCIISTLLISSISEIFVTGYRHSFVISFIICPQTLKITHSFLYHPEEVIFDFTAFSSSKHHFLSNFSFCTVSFCL